MKNLRYNEMVELLMANPDGLRIRAIARSIYNTEVDLFAVDSAKKFRDIHLSVQRFLWTQSRKIHSPFERRRWGIYALKNRFVVQLELEFDDWEDEGVVLEHSNPKKNMAAEQMHDMFEGMY